MVEHYFKELIRHMNELFTGLPVLELHGERLRVIKISTHEFVKNFLRRCAKGRSYVHSMAETLLIAQSIVSLHL
jgi:hypothetical protein